MREPKNYMTVEEFLYIARFQKACDIFIYENKDYDDVVDETEDTDNDLFDLDQSYYLACFKSEMYYRSCSFLRPEINNAKVTDIYFYHRDLVLFIDWSMHEL